MGILSALQSLDTLNDEHWTSDGAPALTALKELTGDESLTRKAVIDAAPSFSRTDTTLEIEKIEGEELNDTEDKDEGEELNDTEDKDEGEELNDTEDKDEGEDLDYERTMEFLTMEKLPLLPDFVDELKSLSEDALTQSMDLFDDMDVKMAETLKAMEERRHELRMFKMVTGKRLNIVSPPMSNQDSLQAYIIQQNILRQERHEQAKSASKATDPRSPIDQVMGRKPKRGSQRPVKM